MHKLATLDNGLKVVTQTMDNMASVALGIWIRSGARYENSGNNGISHLLEHLLFKGTTTRDMKTIKEAIEGRGGSFNGFTSEEHTCYLVKLLAKDVELGVDILSDMVLNPRLDSEEVKKEKDVIVEEINMYMDMPSHYVHEILAEMMWPSHPLGMPLAGTVKSVRSIKKEELIAYKNTYYNPQSMIIVGTGHIDEDLLVNLSKKYLSKTVDKAVGKFKKAEVGQKRPRLKIISKDTEQTHVALGLHSPDRFHPDKHILSLTNILLGANMSSRLFHIVRDELALCYEISSSVRKYEDSGAFVVSAGVDDKKLVKSMEIILKELGRIKAQPVPEEELRRAKEYYKGQLLFALEDTMSHMLWLGDKIIAGERDFDVPGILSRIEGVRPEEIMRVSRGIFKNEGLNLALIGPIKKEDKNLKAVLRANLLR